MKKGMKKWVRNLIVALLEIAIIFSYFAIGGDAILKIFEGDIVGGFEQVISAMWFVNIAILLVTILCFTWLRTKLNVFTGIWNVFLLIGTLYMMYPNP